jgi:UDP-glucose 4-epimerase
LKVLVTGGAGFIGSHLCEQLLAAGYQVRVIDNLSSGNRGWVPEGADFILGDIRDFEVLAEAVEGCDAVCHLAAMSRSGPSVDMMDECLTCNVIGTSNVIKAVKGSSVKRIVYSGSSTYYGLGDAPNCVEDPPDLLNYYGLTKYVGERLLSMFSTLSGIDVITLRYFNVYGPRQPRTGIYALVMGIFLDSYSRGESLVVHGDGHQSRDFIHVRDVAAANVRALNSTTTRSGIFNVGSGETVSILELAKMISSDIVFGERRSGDAQITLADISTTVQGLQWEPQVTFSEGLAEMILLSQKRGD